MKKIMQRLFEGFGLKYIGKLAAAVTGVVLLIEAMYIGSAYCFGAKCVDCHLIYEIPFDMLCLFARFGDFLLFFIGLIVLIILIGTKKRLATLRWVVIIAVSAVEFYLLAWVVEPVQFYCLKGFINHVPQSVDVKAVQNWLSSAKIEPDVQISDYYGSDAPSKEVSALHSRFMHVYNNDGKRALMVSYVSSGTGTLFGIVITGENGAPVIDNEIYPPGWRIKDVNEYFYLWSGLRPDTPPIVEILGLEPIVFTSSFE